MWIRRRGNSYALLKSVRERGTVKQLYIKTLTLKEAKRLLLSMGKAGSHILMTPQQIVKKYGPPPDAFRCGYCGLWVLLTRPGQMFGCNACGSGHRRGCTCRRQEKEVFKRYYMGAIGRDRNET